MKRDHYSIEISTQNFQLKTQHL